jgi:putative transposase
MPLSERIYACGAGCGHIQCRDLNAAINLNNASLQKIRAASAKLTPVDRLGADSPQTLQEANFKEFELFDLSDLCKFCVAY